MGVNNPDLLQEEEEILSEEANDDAAVNAEEINLMITRRMWFLQ